MPNITITWGHSEVKYNLLDEVLESANKEGKNNNKKTSAIKSLENGLFSTAIAKKEICGHLRFQCVSCPARIHGRLVSLPLEDSGRNP